MAIKVIVPEIGESVLEATVHQWMKKEGDFVEAGEALVELETDKVNLEVGAKASGILTHITAQDGQDVKVGDVLGEIDDQATPPIATVSQAALPAAEAPEPEHPALQEKRASEPQPTPLVTPVASRLAREQNIDPAQVHGTGPQGRVTKSDVEEYRHSRAANDNNISQPPLAESEAPLAAPPAMRREERQRMSRRRRTIAQRLLEASQTTAMLTTFNEINMAAVMNLRRRYNEVFQARHGIKLGISSFFVKACLSALKAFPRLNAEIQDDDIVLKYYYDIGIAVGAEEGLVVPVLRDADHLSFAQIEHQIKELALKAKDGSLSVEDLRGGTFTITNGGVFGSMLSTPIINLPQVAILGLHKIEDRPVAQKGEVLIQPMMYAALSYDHRIVDGREAVQFLVHVKELIEDPQRFLLEI